MVVKVTETKAPVSVSRERGWGEEDNRADSPERSPETQAVKLPTLQSAVLTQCFEGIQSMIIACSRDSRRIPASVPLAARYVKPADEQAAAAAYFGLRHVFGVSPDHLLPHYLPTVIRDALEAAGRKRDFPIPAHGILFIPDAHKVLDCPIPADAVFDPTCTQFAPGERSPGIYAYLIAHSEGKTADSLRSHGHVLLPHTAEGQTTLQRLITAYVSTGREERELIPVTRAQLAAKDAHSLMQLAGETRTDGAWAEWSAEKLQHMLRNPKHRIAAAE